MNNKELLSNDGKKLKLFNDTLEINYNLPKWKDKKTDKEGNIYVELRGTPLSVTTLDSNTNTYTTNIPQTIRVTSEEYDELTGKKKDNIEVLLDEITGMSIKELNDYLKSKSILFYLTKSGNYDYSTPFLDSVIRNSDSKEKDMNFFQCLAWAFKKRKKEKYEFDVIDFFTRVKTTTKESTKEYADRVSKYIQAVNNAISNGQTALKEKLLRELVANKYEALLVSEGYYHVIKEEQIVDFIKKCEKGLSLDYIKNFGRPVPQEVSDAIKKVNALEVFDNYVVLHYDPENNAYLDTAKQEEKKRDPILFGVIAGSTKLYYITDWVDDYCDLTLEKFVDTLKIKKDDLIEDKKKRKELGLDKKKTKTKKVVKSKKTENKKIKKK